MKSGQGTFVDHCGNKYTGNFEKDMYHGRGKIVMKSGEIYEG
jgi:hypothetical protein